MSLAHEQTFPAAAGEDKAQERTKKEHVESVVGTRLRQSAYCGVHRASCEYYEGVLILRGRVATYYLKQVAQALVRGMEGVEEVDNRLEVDPPPRRP